MAAERDEAGSPGAGLSGYGRDAAASEGDSAAIGDAPGSAGVHAGIAYNSHLESDTGVAERGVSRVRELSGGASDDGQDLAGRARGLAGDVAERAGELASRARDRVGALADRAQGALEERGLLERIRENPLPALGVAFAAGFLLAGGRRGGGQPASRSQRVRGELRGALTAGLSAGLAQGARAFMRNAGAEDGIINSVMQNLPGMGGEGQGSRGGRSSGGREEGYSSTGGSRGGGYREPGRPGRY